MSENRAEEAPVTQTGAMVVTKEEVQVDMRDVDSIGGAKPEAEERPAYVVTNIDPTTGEQSDVRGAQHWTPKDLVVRSESTVSEVARFYGKTCGRCAHFNHELGQIDIERVALGGTDEERANLDALYNELIVRSVAGPEVVSANEIFKPTGAEEDMMRVGTCVELKSLLKEQIFILPECHCAGPDIPEIKRDLWSPVDAKTERHVSQLRDSLLQTAEGKI